MGKTLVIFIPNLKINLISTVLSVLRNISNEVFIVQNIMLKYYLNISSLPILFLSFMLIKKKNCWSTIIINMIELL